jgi:glucans biosynthesis protein C
MYYVSWDFHVKSPFSGVSGKSLGLEPWMKLSEPWRMSLIFMISGVATALMLRRGMTMLLVRRRTRYLLLPLICGVVFIVPPQSYFEVVEKFSYQGSYIDFLRLYFTGYQGFCTSGNSQCLILPTWNHLWFLPYLWVYTMILFSILAISPNTLILSVNLVDKWATKFSILLLPIALLSIIRITLFTRFPVTHALIDDWFSHANYLSMFALGAIFASAKSTWEKFTKLRWPALIMAISGWAIIVFGSMTNPLAHLIVAGFQWCAVVAAFGFAATHLNRDSRFRSLLTDAVFPIYLLHQTIIIVASQWLKPLQLTPAIEGGLLITGTFAISLLAFAILKKCTPLRPWFGI